ncbi:carbohydrate ABC transporter permease [Nonomuraea sp. CA-143628]|uniref:carbohydrate ABC transporter permease n=1 Tax=Nonomuraea sp. CA-143628 TaxID=3239997 RepID=UPI003D944B4D
MTLTTERAVVAPAKRTGPARRRSNVLVPWLFLAPALILFLYFKYIPMAEGMWLSLFKVQPFLGNEWLGLENYRRVFAEEAFRDATSHTLLYAAGQTVGSILVGFLLALLLEGKAKTLWFVRTAAFLPVVTATAVVAEVWRLLYFPGAEGMLNTLLGWFGSDTQKFLDDPNGALGWVILVGIWKGAPYDMMIIIAGLAGIDRQLYQAAAIDGAGLFQRIRYVTIPALRPVVTILIILASVRSLRVFTEIYVLTGGGPAGATDVIMTRIFATGFRTGDMGFATAASVVLFLATLLLTAAVTLYRRRKELNV